MGLTGVDVALSEDVETEQLYTVRLHFAELEDVDAGQRVFSVRIQGEEVLPNFDPVREAGGPRRTLVREFRDIPVRGRLHVELVPSASAPIPHPLLCGLEVVAGTGMNQIAAR